MRTIIYIDGFNFYYGCVKGTSYKWLDFKKLFLSLLEPEHKITEIKHFTAKPMNDESRKFQAIYFKALSLCIPEITFHYGFFSRYMASMWNAKPPPDKVTVHKVEEKKTDVNIATEMLNDAWLDKYDCAVLVTNDSDMSGAMRRIRDNASQGAFSKKILGLIVPAYNPDRPLSALELEQYADFVRIIAPDKIRGKHGNKISGNDINTEELLQACQLPESTPDTKLYRPIKWQ